MIFYIIKITMCVGVGVISGYVSSKLISWLEDYFKYAPGRLFTYGVYLTIIISLLGMNFILNLWNEK